MFLGASTSVNQFCFNASEPHLAAAFIANRRRPRLFDCLVRWNRGLFDPEYRGHAAHSTPTNEDPRRKFQVVPDRSITNAASHHGVPTRNHINTLRLAPSCCAKTRSRKPCRSPIV